ncbi:carboxymuconolactone decarboxylase family protein [Pendulispora brunnea]|uniref:Carboxymuconolactone decarboxylase family protein n=1 Tax=Pendulispora brunnea TaxID=2905690 RepID=A0ABZ2JW33_9BACT
MKDTLRYDKSIPDVLQALQSVHTVMDKHGFERKLHHLVLLRASQINGCAFCVQMHTKEAREDGETNDRLDRVVVWKHVSDFTEREKAALAWTEALTKLDDNTDLAALRAQLRSHFTEEEIGILTSTVGMINLWNRLQIARH